MSDKIIIATFVREAELANGDCSGIGEPVEVDITAWVLDTPAAEIHYYTDQSKTGDSIAMRLTDWDGPFSFYAEEAIKSFFDVRDLEDVTQKMIDTARKAYMTPKRVFDWINGSDVLTVGDSTLLTSWSTDLIRGDPENEAIIFQWEDGEEDFSIKITEKGLADARCDFAAETIIVTDNEGDEITITSFKIQRKAPSL